MNLLRRLGTDWRLLFSVFVLIATTSCALGKHTSTVKSYLDVKNSYVSALESSSHWGNQPNYRLAVIPPMVEPYVPGTPISKDSYEPLTDACLVPSHLLTVSTDLADPPSSSYDSSFDISLQIPALLKQATMHVVDLRTTIDTKAKALFSLSLDKSINTRTDVLKKATLNEACLDAIVGHEVVMIRGIIYGSELISNGQNLRADMMTTIINDKAIEVRYNLTGGYEVKDITPKPKFWIISDWRVDIPTLRPDLSKTQRIAVIKDHLKDSLLDVSFSVQAPSNQTLTDLHDKSHSAAPTGLRLIIK